MNMEKSKKGKFGKIAGGFGIGTIVVVILAVVLLLIGGFSSNETENWTIVQHPFNFGMGDDAVGAGKILVENEKNPWVPKLFGSTETYPDNVTEFFSSKEDEGGDDGDTTTDKSVKVVFKEKGTASFSAQVVYETPYMLKDQLEFHKLARGDMKKVSKTVQTALNQSCRFVADNMTASQFFESQQEVVQQINELMKNNTLLRDKWKIVIVDIQISDIVADDVTLTLFSEQQTALLNASKAVANQEKFHQQEIEKVAEYKKLIAEEKGKADMVKMKAVTDAEREAKLAIIEAQRKVDVAALEKSQADEIRQKMEIDANAKLRVAEIERAQAEQKAEAVKLLAKAEQERIQLAGAITEKEQVALTINKERDIGVATAWANGNRLTPDFIIGGTGADGSGDLNSTLFSMKLMDSMGLLNSTNSYAPVK